MGGRQKQRERRRKQLAAAAQQQESKTEESLEEDDSIAWLQTVFEEAELRGVTDAAARRIWASVVAAAEVSKICSFLMASSLAWAMPIAGAEESLIRHNSVYL